MVLEVTLDVGRGLHRVARELAEALELLALAGGVIHLEEAHARRRQARRTRVEPRAKHHHLRVAVRRAGEAPHLVIEPCGAQRDPELAVVEEAVHARGDLLAFRARQRARPRVRDQRVRPLARAGPVGSHHQGGSARAALAHRGRV